LGDSGQDVGDVEFKGWEEGSLGGLAWLGSRNWVRLGWIELEWCVGLGCWDQKCFQRRLLAKEATSATRWK
jgi:hypothetical protein